MQPLHVSQRLTRTGWLAGVALVLLAAGITLQLRWPGAEAALRCPPEEVRVGSDGVARCGGSGAKPAAGQGLTLGIKLDLNRASVQELELLPGIGPSLATAIVNRRAAKGGFRSWDELDSVAGVGPTKLAALQAGAELR